MKSFGNDNELKVELISKALALRKKSSFANLASMKRGFDSTGWMVKDLCRLRRFSKVAELLEISEDIIYVYDAFFEWLDKPNYQSVPEQFLSSVPVGADYSGWWRRYFLSLMTGSDLSPLRHQVTPEIHDLFTDIVRLYQDFDASSDDWTVTENKARNLARSAQQIWKESTHVGFPSYQFSSGWLVARACAYVTRYSPWWARAALNRFVNVWTAYHVEIQRTPSAQFFSEDKITAQAYSEFLFSLTLPTASEKDLSSPATLLSQTGNQTLEQTATKTSIDTSEPKLDVSFKIMPKRQFWALIVRSRLLKQDAEEQAKDLQLELQQLKPEEILAFDFRLQETIRDARRWDLWAAAYIINGGCSDDAFEYFLGWLVMQGQSYYERALKDPSRVADRIQPGDSTECARILYVSEVAYENVTNLADFDERRALVPQPIQGTQWSEADVDSLFPNLAEKFKQLT